MRSKKTKTKKIKEKPIRWFVKQCDKEMSLMVREKGICAASNVSMCGGGLQDAHIIGRRNYTLRWDPVNHLCLCYKHHIFFAHHDPVEFLLWFQNKYSERWTYLLEAKNRIIKRGLNDYKELLQRIKSRDIKGLYTIPLDKTD
jgi:hypothetical protein